MMSFQFHRSAPSRFGPWATCLVGMLAGIVLVVLLSWWWLFLAVPATVLWVIGVIDYLQPHHSIRRIYPVIGRMRWLAEDLRPKIRQYFVESDTDGAPYTLDTRADVYDRAKGGEGIESFGTELDVYAQGYEWFLHSIYPKVPAEGQHRVRIGEASGAIPYDMALMNISAMSFGSLSGPAITALNEGARRGGFAHDTGEGAVSPYHRQGGDLVWEIGTAYFGCRTPDGKFDADQFVDECRQTDAIKMISIKLSQGAKPGLGGVLPGSKVTQEIADTRGVPVGETVVSPGHHSAFDGPDGLVEFVARLREISGNRPTGFKLCVGQRTEFLSAIRAMISADVYPDFIIVDGSEGGTGAAPLEFEDHAGVPLDDGLATVHSALVGAGIRGRIRIGASGKVGSGFDIARRLAQGADYTNSARTMMFALGCIQAQECHTNKCPSGVTSHNPMVTRGIDVEDKAQRVCTYQRSTVNNFNTILGVLGHTSACDVRPDQFMRRISQTESVRYDELWPVLPEGSLLDGSAPEAWMDDWKAAGGIAG
ncbi:Putative glutamate synthase [Candidatus Microthrix parvicella RN1]|jgi:glutamate synthase domain-containing protein 2|uniref:Putative glutamate synthase n=2 Tax=Microthrixaceae TaxID=1798913 RepID=R4Z5C5_9ACTN|nr:Putative glutamate synthase [Candidatus Microthrix parvicella RN1]